MTKVGPKNPFSVTDTRVEPATEKQVRALEKRLRATLPADYRKFLMTINGGRRPGGGWELPKYEMAIDTFYGLRGDHYDLADAVQRVLKAEEGTSNYPADTIPIGYELTGNPILMKYRGDDAGSIWFWDERPKPRKRPWRKGDPPIDEDDDWLQIAASFETFIAMLHQEPEPRGRAAVRDILDRDDVEAMRRYVNTLPPGKLDEQDKSSGYSLIQSAANLGAVNVVRLLLDRGARNMAGLGIVNTNRHAAVTEVLLTYGSYTPTEYDWQGAAAFGGPAVLQLYFDHAAKPPAALLRKLIQNSKNLEKDKPTEERREIIRMLEAKLAATPNDAGGSVRKLNIRPKKKK